VQNVLPLFDAVCKVGLALGALNVETYTHYNARTTSLTRI
jgi:hypothetical protein